MQLCSYHCEITMTASLQAVCVHPRVHVCVRVRVCVRACLCVCGIRPRCLVCERGHYFLSKWHTGSWASHRLKRKAHVVTEPHTHTANLLCVLACLCSFHFPSSPTIL